jgi:hypothetical protein
LLFREAQILLGAVTAEEGDIFVAGIGEKF